jgi:hypothetical protein
MATIVLSLKISALGANSSELKNCLPVRLHRRGVSLGGPKIVFQWMVACPTLAISREIVEGNHDRQ